VRKNSAGYRGPLRKKLHEIWKEIPELLYKEKLIQTKIQYFVCRGGCRYIMVDVQLYKYINIKIDMDM
jgi:hypothetical protein